MVLGQEIYFEKDLLNTNGTVFWRFNTDGIVPLKKIWCMKSIPLDRANMCWRIFFYYKILYCQITQQ